MAKNKAGLHKKVSAIFDGVLLESDNAAPGPPRAPAPERPKDKLPSKRKKELSEPPAPRKQPAQSYMTSTTLQPQKQQPVQLPPKTTPAKQPDIGATRKVVKRIPWQQSLQQIRDKLFASKPGVSDTRQKTMTILIPVLFITLIFVLTRVLRTPSPMITKAQGFGPSSAVASSTKIDWQIPPPYPTTLRDPMRFGSPASGSEADGIIVKGIVYSKDNPSAVIGNRIVHEGDKVLGATVVKISENSVDFEMNDKKWTQKVQ